MLTMAAIRIRSVADPFDEVPPEVVRDALNTIILAESMGLLSEEEVVERLDLATIQRVARVVGEAGIGSAAATSLARTGLGGQELREAVRLLRESLEQSPLPGSEWKALVELFGVDRLAQLVAVSPSSLRRYASTNRPTPDPVAGRVHFLAKVVADLKGAYNEIGIRRWFERPRGPLGGRSPAQLLKGSWDPEGPGAGKVRDLARSLTSSPAT